MLVPRRTSLTGVTLAALVLALGGCAFDGPMSTLAGRSDYGRAILHVYAIVTWATAIIGVLVFVLLGYVLARFRARPEARLPAQVRGHTLLELTWTILPALVLLVIAIPTIRIVFRTQAMAAPPGALQVIVRGWQWWWEFRYPELGVVTANELHLPVGRTVVLNLEGHDVIHSFWVPHLGGKRDVVPGRHNRIVLEPDRPGEHWGQCAEFCGASHANMGMRVIVEPPAQFDAWMARQKAPRPSRRGSPPTARRSSPRARASAATRSRGSPPACSRRTSRTSAAGRRWPPGCGPTRRPTSRPGCATRKASSPG